MQIQRDTSSHCSYDQWSFSVKLDSFMRENIFLILVNISCLSCSFFMHIDLKKIKLQRIVFVLVWNLRNKGNGHRNY